MKKKLTTAAILTALLLTLSVTPANASPNGLCIPGQCGQVTNYGPKWLTVKNAQFTSSLAPGQYTNSYYDWDYVWIPAGGCIYRIGPTSAIKACAALKSGGYWYPNPNSGRTKYQTAY